MKLSALEYGTFWLADATNGPLPLIPARIDTTFQEADYRDLAGLQTTMEYTTPDTIRARLQTGRRCFTLKKAGQIISYGWVSRKTESVGELERDFHFQDDEVYVWHCGTIPEYRGHYGYTSLLSHIIRQYYSEGVQRVWIGASHQNKPSVRGILRAGFQHIVDLTYRRFWRLKLLRFFHAPNASPASLAASYRILLDNEWRIGSFAFGIKQT